MEKIWTLIKNNLLIVFVFGFSFLVVVLLTIFAGKPITITIPNSEIIPTPAYVIHMQGKTGVDALTLLEEHAQVKLNTKQQIIAINKVNTNSSSDQYWVFYVNDKLVTINPQKYQTNNSEMIVWKIEKR
jgi:hypothetical protein